VYNIVVKKFNKHNGKCGVYCLYLYPEKRYVGSSINIGRRLSQHERNLRLNKHVLDELQSDYSKYQDLKVEILEYVDEQILLTKECEWAAKFNLYNKASYSTPIVDLSEKQIDKFWSLVDKTDECWIWEGNYNYKDRQGYGRISFNCKRYQAHRISFYLSGKPWLVNSIICHLCNNKQCVNPDHLMLGSHATNHRQRVDDGIGCVLDKKKARIIREECISHQGKKYKDLAELFNNDNGWSLKYYHIRDVIENKSFSDKDWDVESYKVYVSSGENSSSSKLNWEIVGFIREIYLTQKITLQQISDLIQNKFNITINFRTVHKIVKNQRWFDDSYNGGVS